eukprot:4989631-Prymnesium_polylepis.1
MAGWHVGGGRHGAPSTLATCDPSDAQVSRAEGSDEGGGISPEPRSPPSNVQPLWRLSLPRMAAARHRRRPPS